MGTRVGPPAPVETFRYGRLHPAIAAIFHAEPSRMTAMANSVPARISIEHEAALAIDAHADDLDGAGPLEPLHQDLRGDRLDQLRAGASALLRPPPNPSRSSWWTPPSASTALPRRRRPGRSGTPGPPSQQRPARRGSPPRRSSSRRGRFPRIRRIRPAVVRSRRTRGVPRSMLRWPRCREPGRVVTLRIPGILVFLGAGAGLDIPLDIPGFRVYESRAFYERLVL